MSTAQKYQLYRYYCFMYMIAWVPPVGWINLEECLEHGIKVRDF